MNDKLDGQLANLHEQITALCRHHSDMAQALCDALSGKRLTPETRTRFALVAEVENLVLDRADSDRTADRMRILLEGTATGLKGPCQRGWWSWHDLPAIATAYRDALATIALMSSTPFPASIAAKALDWKENG